MPGADGLPSVLPAAPADPRPEVFRGWSRVSRRSCCSADASARRLGTWLYGVREWDSARRSTQARPQRGHLSGSCRSAGRPAPRVSEPCGSILRTAALSSSTSPWRRSAPLEPCWRWSGRLVSATTRSTPPRRRGSGRLPRRLSRTGTSKPLRRLRASRSARYGPSCAATLLGPEGTSAAARACLADQVVGSRSQMPMAAMSTVPR